MKQQFTGSYTLDVASRTIVLSGIEIPPERLAVVINSSVGFVYHNIEHEPTATVTVSGGDTTIVFPRYKDCETHRNSDALSIFYDDGVDLGKLIKDESDETQTLLTDFKTEVKEEFDSTQTLLTDFKTEVRAESDATQAFLQSEFDATQTLLSDFKTESKAESDAAQTLLQSEFDATQTLLTDFKAEVKTSSDGLQMLLGSNLPTLAEGMVPSEFLSMFEAPNDVDVDFVPGGYGPARIIYSRNGATLRAVNLHYGDSGDALGKLVLVTPALWTPAELTTRNAWFDASFADSITQTGADVTAWRDRTANGFSFIRPSGVPAPKVGASFFNLPTIAFDGGAGYLQSRLNGSIRSLTNLARNTLYTQEAIFIVARTKSDYFGNWLMTMGVTAGDGAYRAIIDGNDPDRLLWRKSGVYEDQIRYDPSEGWNGGANSTHLLGFIATPTTAELYDSGRLVERHNTTGTARAGGWDRIGLESNVDFAEMLFLSEVPDEPTRQRIEGYLAHKWGLSGQLPAMHPYRFAPPGI